MIIGHAPSGYIAASFIFKHHTKIGITRTQVIFFCIFGALAPDLDMLYFYLVDNRQSHHHTYFPHWPIIWVSAFFASFALYKINKNRNAYFALIFCIGGCIHLLLDSIVGDIWWLYPFIDKPYSIAIVPALYKPWWLNFIFHWSFLLEILLWCWAFLIYHGFSNNSFKGRRFWHAPKTRP